MLTRSVSAGLKMTGAQAYTHTHTHTHTHNLQGFYRAILRYSRSRSTRGMQGRYMRARYLHMKGRRLKRIDICSCFSKSNWWMQTLFLSLSLSFAVCVYISRLRGVLHIASNWHSITWASFKRSPNYSFFFSINLTIMRVCVFVHFIRLKLLYRRANWYSIVVTSSPLNWTIIRV